MSLQEVPQWSETYRLESENATVTVKRPITSAKEKPYACNVCKYKCATEALIQRHTRIHTGEQKNPCPICNFEATTPGYLKQHVNKKHRGESVPLQATVVPNVNDTVQSPSHMTFEVDSAGALNVHVKTPARERTYACQECNYKCTNKKVLQQHTRIHTGYGFVCDICGYKATAPAYLNQHILKKHKRGILNTYDCTVCDFKSTQEGITKQHMRVHSADKIYSCNECNFKTTSAGYLKCHRVKHTGNYKSTLKAEDITIAMLKPFACNKCDFRSSYKRSLDEHLRKQSSDLEPFQCVSCDFKSVCPSRLTLHIDQKHQ